MALAWFPWGTLIRVNILHYLSHRSSSDSRFSSSVYIKVGQNKETSWLEHESVFTHTGRVKYCDTDASRTDYLALTLSHPPQVISLWERSSRLTPWRPHMSLVPSVTLHNRKYLWNVFAPDAKVNPDLSSTQMLTLYMSMTTRAPRIFTSIDGRFINFPAWTRLCVRSDQIRSEVTWLARSQIGHCFA